MLNMSFSSKGARSRVNWQHEAADAAAASTDVIGYLVLLRRLRVLNQDQEEKPCPNSLTIERKALI